MNCAFGLSINDRPEMREAFGAFRMEEVPLKYTIGLEDATEAAELVVKNGDAPARLL